jgi:hypothetical protein
MFISAPIKKEKRRLNASLSSRNANWENFSEFYIIYTFLHGGYALKKVLNAT